MAVATAIIFSGFVVYDTYNIMNRLSPEEYIIASVELYLDLLNLFLAILRIYEREREGVDPIPPQDRAETQPYASLQANASNDALGDEPPSEDPPR